MLKKEFIRMNIDDKHLSIGNLFRIIKEQSCNTNIFWQPELFSIIFDTYNVADSTVNNYCTGFRAINIKYKDYLKEIKNKYDKDKNVLIPIIHKIMLLVESNKFCSENKYQSIDNINESIKLKNICNRLYSISKNDTSVEIKFVNELYTLLESNNLYDFICKTIFYVVLEKKQPIYINNTINEMIEKNIYNTNISLMDIQEFISIQLNSSIWSLRGIQKLAQKQNPFACFEMASLEFYGLINKEARYDRAYEYYKVAAKKNHPVANWAIGYLYYEGYIGNKSKKDLYLAFKYFNKARKLNCSNAYNSFGLIILNGSVPHIKKNKNVAIKYFEKAISLGNVCGYNNLGKIYENEKNYKKSFEYYKISADLGDSWAANKVGEYYRKGIGTYKDLKKAFEYYNLSSNSPKYTLCEWSKYNLAKYYYLSGNLEIGIKKDVNKALSLFDEVCDKLICAIEEIIYIYYNLYIESKMKEKFYLEKLEFYKRKCENHLEFDEKIKERIEEKLQKLNKKIFLEIPNI